MISQSTSPSSPMVFSCKNKVMTFLCRAARLAACDGVRSLEVQRDVRKKLLLLQIERNQLRWFGHYEDAAGMPHLEK